MNEHHLVTRRTARYYVLGGMGAPGARQDRDGPDNDVADPAGRAAASVREVWFVLHGYAQLARYFIRPFSAIADASRLIVAPEALNRYYFETAPGEHARDARVAATWMTREDREHEIGDYVAYLDLLAEHVVRDVASTTLTVLGFSQGAATASRWVATGRTRADRLVLWGSGVPHDLPLGPDVFRGAALTIAVGTADRHVDDERIAREEARLAAAGIESTTFRYEGGHRIEADALQQLAAR